MSTPFEEAIDQLTDIQQQAVEWNQGPLLVLAGPGSGKTQVLTCRIARLLDASRDKNFRVLALTFTNKAADEMKGRVATFVSGLEERANIGTFHSFCAQVLRQHGVHIGIKPDFVIYSVDIDRRAVLEDALRREEPGGWNPSNDSRYLGMIDRLKSRLVTPDGAEEALARLEERERIARAYRLYEEELRRVNALDFNSLILEVYRLVTDFPAIAARYRRSHPYWLVDEFQDTNTAQYRLLKALAGDDFRSLFAVADDDQIIYQWNGASFRQIQAFRRDFDSALVQLPTNFRCPPVIVEAANRLVVYNVQRTDAKEPILAGKTDLRFPPEEHIQLRTFATEREEAAGIAREIAERDPAEWGETAVLARTRRLLEGIHHACQQQQVPAVIARRRDDFLSPEFRWLAAILQQAVRPLDARNAAVLVESFNRIANINVAADQVIAEAEATGQGYLNTWATTARAENLDSDDARLLEAFTHAEGDAIPAVQAIETCLEDFSRRAESRTEDTDLIEDLSAWRELWRDIGIQIGRHAPLDQYLQQLQLRSKEPSPKPGTITLMTIHGAKGREFDHVYVIGLAEDILPSFQSQEQGDDSPELEEERRNCFVAITRTKERLVLSHAREYRGWPKEASRFLIEMQLAD
jgi:DNA helicase-2/ATP-dependent DNA helicase PcrA